MIGKTVSHYEIVRKLGAGGMGVVYEAKDLNLPRTVAIKFLPPTLRANESSKKRFLHEARAISTLEHPNITAIHEMDETPEGDHFIVMPHYDGQTLTDHIAQGPMDIERAVEFTSQIALGLAKAHDNDIIHRDIKPANIFVTKDDVVKILDFGIAKLIGQTKITRADMTVGTAYYMSPEQAKGEDLDHRTDIWSVAVVLYEMLTSKLPFKGDVDVALLYSILSTDPEDISAHRSDVPRHISRVIKKALQKNPAHRYTHMNELLSDLGAVSRPVTSTLPRPKEVSIAVLPFDDISPGKDNEFISDGLAEEMITDLSQIKATRVISRNSAIMFKGSDKDVHTIAEELNVRYVVRGSVRRADDKLRVNVHLVDSSDESNLWARKFSGVMDDIFEIQETVSRSIVDALQLELSSAESVRLVTRGIDDVRAYEFYLRAREESYLVREDALDKALGYLKSGLEIVGDNALLYAGMAHTHFQYVNIGINGPEHLEKASECVDKVLEIEPMSPHGHRLKGLMLLLNKDFQESVNRFKKALEIDPNDPDSMFWLIQMYMVSGKTDAAAVLVEKLLKIDPMTPLNQAGPGWIHFFEGRFESAIDPIRQMYQTAPQEPLFRYQYIQMLVYNNRHKEALKLIDALADDAPGHPLSLLCQLLKYSLRGKKGKAEELLTPELEAMAKSDAAYSWLVANCYALLDEKEKAIDWLEHAVDMGFINYPFISQHDRLLDNVRGHERLDRLLERVKAAWMDFAA